LSRWDVSQVTDMEAMFHGAISFCADLSRWDVSQVTNMSRMFYGATAFSADLSRWDVSRVTNMAYMFKGATSFSADLSQWDIRRVTYWDYMLTHSGIYTKWGLTTLKDIPFNHPYFKSGRIHAFSQLTVERHRRYAIALYV